MPSTLVVRAEERAEKLFYIYMGTLRVRSMSTEMLKSMYDSWEGEASLRDIPIDVIKEELQYRGQCILNVWCSK